jgi:hypothetical protein
VFTKCHEDANINAALIAHCTEKGFQMISGHSIVYLLAFFSLWTLSVVGGIAVLLSWLNLVPEYDEEGFMTLNCRYLARARALLTAGCMVFWVCTILGHVLTGSSRNVDFGFWQDHPILLVGLFCLADVLLIPSVVFAWQAHGGGRWILWISTPIMAVTSIAASFVLCMATFST